MSESVFSNQGLYSGNNFPNALDFIVRSIVRQMINTALPVMVETVFPGDENAAKMMREINAAYEQIQNPEKYQNYGYTNQQNQTNNGYAQNGFYGYNFNQNSNFNGFYYNPFGFRTYTTHRTTRIRNPFVYLFIIYFIINLISALFRGFFYNSYQSDYQNQYNSDNQYQEEIPDQDYSNSQDGVWL